MSGVFQLLYLSHTPTIMGEQELVDLLGSIRSKNEAQRITGLLVYRDAAFMQLLEGERDVVVALYEKVKRDPRHTNVKCVYTGWVRSRDCPDWSMGFRYQAGLEQKVVSGLNPIMVERTWPSGSEDDSIAATLLRHFVDSAVL